MICKIDTNYNAKRIAIAVDSHERKVDAGVATRDEIQLAGFDRETITQALLQHVHVFNPQVRKNKFHQVTISFDPGDAITDIKKREAVDRWMEHMGYLDHPYVLYHHNDKAHDHWHLITTCSNLEGVRANTRNNFHKSAIYTRKLEAEYGIRVLSSQAEKKDQDLKEIAAKKFAFKNAIENMPADAKIRFGVEEVTQQLGRTTAYSGMEFASAYRRLYGSKPFSDLHDYLIKNGLQKYTKKERLYFIVSDARFLSKSEVEFISKLKDEGVYVRKVFDKGTRFLYGFENYYIKDYSLSRDFTPESLSDYFSLKTSDQHSKERGKKQRPETIKFLGKTLHRAIQYSNTFDEFMAYLNDKKISVVLASNSGGVYGYSVKYNGEEYKASTIDKNLSYSKIINRIGKNKLDDMPAVLKGKISKPLPSPTSPLISTNSSKPTPNKAAQGNSLARGLGKIGRGLGHVANSPEEELSEEEIKRRTRNNQISW